MTNTRKITDGTGFIIELILSDQGATVYYKGKDGIVYGGGDITKEKYHEIISDCLTDGMYFM